MNLRLPRVQGNVQIRWSSERFEGGDRLDRVQDVCYHIHTERKHKGQKDTPVIHGTSYVSVEPRTPVV